MKSLEEITEYRHQKKKSIFLDLNNYILEKENYLSAHSIDSDQKAAIREEVELLKSAAEIIQTITCNDHKKQVVLDLVKLIDQKQALLSRHFDDKEELVELMSEITSLKRTAENMEWDCFSVSERKARYEGMLSLWKKWERERF
jgi:hypothetical protein